MILILLFVSTFIYSADDTIVAIAHEERPTHEELADIILNDFFSGNHDHVRDRVRIVLAERISNQNESTQSVLIQTYERAHGTPSIGEDTSQDVSNKVFELFTDSIQGVVQEEQEETDRWRLEARSRCKKITVATISALLGLAGAAVGAGITAAIESARCDC